jgi:hypothetical protein
MAVHRARLSWLFIMVAGYGSCRVSWASGVERESGKKTFKIFFFLASACAGKKENSAVQNGTVPVFCFFFLRKENVIWRNPKIGYGTFHGGT